MRPVTQKKYMPNDFGLLLQPILVELPSRFQAVIITAKGVSPQRQAYAFLMLPHMHQLMDEQALQAEAGVAKIATIKIALGMKPYMPVRGHDNAARLKPKIPIIMNADTIIIER